MKKTNINKKSVKKLLIPILIVVLIIAGFIIKQNYMENEFTSTVNSMNEEIKNLSDKITLLEKDLEDAHTENGIMADQLRNAREDLRDAGRRVKDNDDKLLIEAYEMFVKGNKEEAQKKVEILDTTYLTDLQLYIYKIIMIDK